MAEKDAKTAQAQNLEASLERLEEIVARLELGDIPLEEAMGLFEEGVGIIRGVNIKLDEAEKKVEMLVKTGLKAASGPAAEEED